MKAQIFTRQLNYYTSNGWREASAKIGHIRMASLARAGLTVDAFLKGYKDRIATVTFLAGEATRWVNSIKAAQEKGLALNVDLEKPRCLAPVPDILGGGEIPIGAYNLRAIKGIGKNIIVYRTHLREIKKMAEGEDIKEAIYVKEEFPGSFDMLLGHGDAMRQVLPSLNDSIEFVITNFGGDPNSRQTIITSLLVIAAMRKAETDLLGLIPTSLVDNPKYPIRVDENGLPVSFGHSRLMGRSSIANAQTNLGLRLYLREPLSMIVDEVFRNFFDPKKGYLLNQDNPEFGLDNIDMIMAGTDEKFAKVNPKFSQRGKLRTLCIGDPAEISGSVKEWGDIAAFIAAQRLIAKES
jgi:hypothetical protein